MTEQEKIIIYDCMQSLKKYAPKLVEILNEGGYSDKSTAYKQGLYSVVVRLGSLFTDEQLENQKKRLATKPELNSTFKTCEFPAIDQIQNP